MLKTTPNFALFDLPFLWKLGESGRVLSTSCWSFTYDRTSEIHLMAIHWARWIDKKKLENVAIVNALQLEAARSTLALCRFNYDAMPSLMSPNLCRIIAFLQLIHYFTMWPWPLTPWPWPLTFDLEHLQRIACDVLKLCTKFEPNRTIRGRVIAISVFDLMTLNMF